jgi:hypothetical protein
MQHQISVTSIIYLSEMVVDLLVIIELAMSALGGSIIAKRLRELALEQSNETTTKKL